MPPLLLFLLPVFVLAQRKYPFEYSLHLKSDPSTFTAQSTDTTLAPDNCLLTFQILDKDSNALPFAMVTIGRPIKNSATDRLMSDMNGIATVSLTPGTFSIGVVSSALTPLAIDSVVLRTGSSTKLKVILMPSKALRIAHVYSIRKLTEKELERLVNDLSHERKDIKLIKKKTCRVTWEI